MLTRTRGRRKDIAAAAPVARSMEFSRLSASLTVLRASPARAAASSRATSWAFRSAQSLFPDRSEELGIRG